MSFEWSFIALAGFAAIFAGISKGGFGSGAAFAAASVLALVIEPGMALGVMLPLLMLIDLASLPAYWGAWSWRDARVMILGAIPGVALGAWLYTLAAPDALRLMIGVISIAFVGWQWATRGGAIRLGQRRLPLWSGYLAGLCTGFTSFISHAGGPPAAIYLLSRGLGKTSYQASTVLIFWIVNIAKFVPYAFLGLFTAQTLLVDLLLAPFALLGTWIGVRAHRLVSERVFFGLTYLLLLVTGSKLIWDGLSP